MFYILALEFNCKKLNPVTKPVENLFPKHSWPVIRAGSDRSDRGEMGSAVNSAALRSFTAEGKENPVNQRGIVQCLT